MMIVGNYRIERELGRGGMGIVYAAVHERLGREVALKVLLPEVSRDDELLQRFFNEARAAAAITHPGIVTVYDVGEHEGQAFIAMELLRGQSLAERLRGGAAMPVEEAIEIARQCAITLAVAHDAKIVHRDLKPDNIFLVPTEHGTRVVLVDFGVAKLVDSAIASTARTVTGAILGTPHYMSPEQCEGAREVDARSDLYSLGCVLFQMVTGRLPFRSAGIGGLIGMHLHVAPPRASTLAAAIPPALDDLIDRLLAKDPADRPATALALADALATVMAPRSREGRRSRPAVSIPPPEPAQRSRLARAALIAVPVVVVGGAIMAWVIASPHESVAVLAIPDATTVARQPVDAAEQPADAVPVIVVAAVDATTTDAAADGRTAQSAEERARIGSREIAAAGKAVANLMKNGQCTKASEVALDADRRLGTKLFEATKVCRDQVESAARQIEQFADDEFPANRARAISGCHRLAELDIDRVSFSMCVRLACRQDASVGSLIISRAPNHMQAELARICTASRKSSGRP